jgi:hypothetical protein
VAEGAGPGAGLGQGTKTPGKNQCFGSGFIDSGSSILSGKRIWIQSFEKSCIILLSKIAIYLILGLHKGCLNYRKSLQPSKENIQHFRTRNFLTFFYFYGGFFPPRSGSTDLI